MPRQTTSKIKAARKALDDLRQRILRADLRVDTDQFELAEIQESGLADFLQPPRKQTDKQRLRWLLEALQKTERSRLFARIREVDISQDAQKFDMADLKAAGLVQGVPAELLRREEGHRNIVLLYHQNRMLRQELAKHERTRDVEATPQIDDLRKRASRCKDPLERVRLRNELMEKEKDARAELADATLQATQKRHEEVLSNLAKFSTPDTDRESKPLHPKPWLWHEPMTQNDYVQATGLTRPSIRKILTRLKAKPDIRPERENERAQYLARTNFGVLRVWLLDFVKKPLERRGYFASNLVHCWRNGKRSGMETFKKETTALMKLLSGKTKAEHAAFWDYVDGLMKALSPPRQPPPAPEPYDPFRALLGPSRSVGNGG